MEYKIVSDITYHQERASVVFIIQDDEREVILCSISRESILDFTGTSKATDNQLVNFIRLRIKNIIKNIPLDPAIFKTETNHTTTFKVFTIESINCKKFFEKKDAPIKRPNSFN